MALTSQEINAVGLAVCQCVGTMQVMRAVCTCVGAWKCCAMANHEQTNGDRRPLLNI